MNRAVYEAVKERADGRCECCGLPFGDSLQSRAELDHFFGRAKADEAVETCWMLRADHHGDKSANRPRAAFWLRLFLVHCVKHSYVEAEQRALKRWRSELLQRQSQAGGGLTLPLSNGPKWGAARAKERRMAAVADLFPETRPDVSEDEAFDERYTIRETLAWCMAEANVTAFDLDVAACAEASCAARYYDKAQNGLLLPWFGRVWCNPPYSDIAPWVTKAWAEWNAGNVEVIAMLIPATRTEQSWWQRDAEPYRDGRGSGCLATHFMPGRTSFARPGSGGVGQSGSPFGTVLLIWRRP